MTSKRTEHVSPLIPKNQNKPGLTEVENSQLLKTIGQLAQEKTN